MASLVILFIFANVFKMSCKPCRKFVEQFAIQIAEKWYRFYILKEPLICEKINKKI